jgi:small-conductance mechanosensitive channel
MEEILNKDLFDIEDYHFTLFKLFTVIFIIIVTYIVIWSAKKFFRLRARNNSLDMGKWLAYYQIFKYIILVIAFSLVLQAIGVKITILIASSTALFIGVGIGMQQIFNDLVSGLILLIEGSVRVNDILDVDGEILKVKKIGVRASEVVNRDDIDVILPNSKLVSNKITNLSHNVQNIRFIINVGVAYGSDVDLVIELLEAAAKEHKEIYIQNPPRARLVNFGDSSLDFELLFWSSNMFRIRNIKSDLRRGILKKFELSNIQIPFPQRDVHIKK